MIRRIVDLALSNRLLVLTAGAALLVLGAISFHQLPVEAYPDVADNYVEIITQWPGIAAEQIEQQVTIPLESVLNGIPGIAYLRSFSLFGLSDIKLIFEDGTSDDWNRERALERMSQASLPPGVTPTLGTDWSPAGQIYFFTLHSSNPLIDVMELKSIEDWVVEKNLKAVPDIVDVATFGGLTREYQVRVDPDKLIAYGLSLAQIEQQLANNNVNAGGSFLERGQQQVNVQELGLVRSVRDIENTVLVTKNGTPLRVKDIAVVAQGPKIPLGKVAKAIHRPDGVIVDDPDVVSAWVPMRKGADAEPTLDGLHTKIDDLNAHVLPAGVRIVPFLDRSDLVHYTTHTVLRNLGVGIALVVIVLLLFLGNFRAALIVSLTIPFSLLFAATCLKEFKIPANLLSLGALDFGMVVDGAVVMVENIVRHLGRSDEEGGTPVDQIRRAAHEVQRPVFYAILIIITAYLPIFTLQRVEGRLFEPMAWTVSFALLGALIFSMLLAPVLASFLYRRPAREWKNPVVTWITERYRRAVTWSVEHRVAMIGVAAVAVGCSGYLWLGNLIGSEFLPHLDEGALWVRGTMAPSTGPTEGIRVGDEARILLARFPEATVVTSQVGRPDDGTDTTGFFNAEFFVDLKPKEEWRPEFRENKDALIAAMDRQLQTIPGVDWGFSQPIEDNVEEAVSGIKGELAMKIYGDDLKTLEDKGNQAMSVMKAVPGIEDLALYQLLGQPSLNFTVDRAAAARYQINVADIQDAVQTAVGGTALTQVLQGEARYDLVLRYLPQYRTTKEAIENIRLLAPDGERVSLAQLTVGRLEDGPSEIYREANQRYIAVRFSVRGRDLGSTVEEAIKKVGQQVTLPRGYRIKWEGEYESQKRSQARLLLIVPLTILLIFLIIYAAFGSAKWALLQMVNVGAAAVGGLLALFLTGTHFSVSSGVGLLALSGVSVQIGVIMIEYINQLRAHGYPIERAAIEGAVRRLRPIMMTMLVATLGLLPAALSHDIGSDSQRPFAIVIVGGLVVDLLLSTFLLPTFYMWWASPNDRLPIVDPDADFVVGDN